MSDFEQKTRELLTHVTLSPSSVPPLDPVVTVNLMDGKSIMVGAQQVPVKPVSANYNTWRYNATGQYNNALNQGGLNQVKIDRGSGSGRNIGPPYIRMHVFNNTGADVEMIPCPLWFQNIQCLTPDGAPIQNHDGSGLWSCICEAYDDDAWKNVRLAINASPDYESGFRIPNGVTAVYLVPMITNYLGMTKFPNFCVDGDQIFNFYFWPFTTTGLFGAAPQLQFFSLDVQQEQLSDKELMAIKAYRRIYETFYIYPYERVQRVQQNWAAASRYTIPANGIKGDVTMVRHYLRNSMVGADLYHYNPITDFQWQNSAGNPISGAQVIDNTYNRRIQQTEWFMGSAQVNRSKYAFVWSAEKNAALSFLLGGVKYGAYPFTTNEQFIIDTAVAGSSEVYSLTAVGGTPTAGSFTLGWIQPVPGASFETTANLAAPTLPWNATATQIKNAIEAMINFTGTVTTTGGPIGTSAVTITMAGNYANTNLFAKGFQLVVMNNNIMSATNNLQNLVLLLVTPGVDGITNNGSYILDLQAYTSGFLKLKTNGGLEIAISG